MTELTTCYLCRDVSVWKIRNVGDRTYVSCRICGEYAASRSVLVSTLNLEERRLTPIQYANLSHRVRMVNDEGAEISVLTTYNVDDILDGPGLPSPASQATNMIRFFGKQIASSGEQSKNPPLHFHASIGSPNRPFALRVFRQLVERGLFSCATLGYLNTKGEPDGIDLTLAGWELFEAEQKGQVSGSFGFIAMKFSDEELDRFQKEVIKPAVQAIGYPLEDLRDASRAGVIDNLMRARIRDAAFVLVDLTHDNSGAYWEAGYAEGLGKPVLYICKKSVFDERGTHFDTNHCTTVMWDVDKPDKFSEELKATLRRSLGLFSS